MVPTDAVMERLALIAVSCMAAWAVLAVVGGTVCTLTYLLTREPAGHADAAADAQTAGRRQPDQEAVRRAAFPVPGLSVPTPSM